MCFFFSSRRRHRSFKCDWSSGVCSSDLLMRWLDCGTEVNAVMQRPFLGLGSFGKKLRWVCEGDVALHMMNALKLSVIPERQVIGRRIGPTITHRKEVPALFLDNITEAD